MYRLRAHVSKKLLFFRKEGGRKNGLEETVKSTEGM